MRILFDQGTPRPLRRHLASHDVKTCAQMGSSELKNGELLDAAENLFDLLITTDKNIPHQQNLRDRRLVRLVLPEPTWPVVRVHAEEVLLAVNSMKPDEYRELKWQLT